MGIEDLRRNYTAGQLAEADLVADPIEQFKIWFAKARDTQSADWFEVNAMTLATATRDGTPSSRVLLLKKIMPDGFAFFTNYRSAKADQLAENPHAAMVFFWPHVEKQVRIEGAVRKTDAATSDEYFHQRPRGSQIGAVASPQSSRIAGRDELQAEVDRVTAELGDGPIERPEYWGGYLLEPTKVEFWQGRPSRLHDRFIYEKDSAGMWQVGRIAP